MECNNNRLIFNDFFNENQIIDFLNVFINPNNSYISLYKKVIFDKSHYMFPFNTVPAKIDLAAFKISGYYLDSCGGSFPSLTKVHASVIDDSTIIDFYNNLYKRCLLLQ